MDSKTKTPEFDGAARIPTLITELTRANHLFPLYQCIEALSPEAKLYIHRELEQLLQNESLGMDDKEWTEFQQSSKIPLKRPKLIEITVVYYDTSEDDIFKPCVFDSVETAAKALLEWNEDIRGYPLKELNTLQKCLDFVKIDKNHTKYGKIWCHHIEPYTTIPDYEYNQSKYPEPCHTDKDE